MTCLVASVDSSLTVKKRWVSDELISDPSRHFDENIGHIIFNLLINKYIVLADFRWHSCHIRRKVSLNLEG